MLNHPRIFPVTLHIFMVLSLLLGSALTVTPVYAAGITVNTTADEDNTGANCSLREAITAANTDMAYGGCTAGSSADIITLPAGTYTLTIPGGNEDSNETGDLDITSDLTINGAGAGTTKIQAGTIGYPNPSPNGIDRVIEILGIRSISISDITIANGNCLIPDTDCDGGGINIQSTTSTVVITDSIFSGNSADAGGGVWNRGDLTIIDNVFSNNNASLVNNGHGGGILNMPSATLDVTNSTFSDNFAAGVGGAIHLNGALSITNSTFQGNTSLRQGGGISIYNGGIHSVTNSTFSDNTAEDDGGGIYNYNGTLTVTNSTFSGNGATIGGGINNADLGTLHLKNTLLANSVSGVDCYNFDGDIIATNTNNLIETNGSSGNMCGTPTVSADPNLGLLTGSPAYFPLNTGSPAIDAGDDTVCAAAPVNNTSQNGVARPEGVHCDIGSFEAPPIVTLTMNSVAANDGWILESTETSGNGGTLNSTATNFSLGDDAANKQYRAILHFDTSSLPDNAVITSATLKIKQQGIIGTDPFTLLGDLKASVRKPAFGAPTLTLSDFKSAPGKNNVATFSNTPVSNWYSALVNNTGRVYINRTGTTQFRLAFTIDDNNDNAADLIKFYSGDAAAANRPQLVIQYYAP
jgi:CSLREA domain-containing protein